MFDSKPVLSMRSSGRDLRFVFDTSDLKPFPVLALPVTENPPAPMNPMMNNPMLHSHILAQTGNPNVAPMMNQMMYGNQQYQQSQMPPAMDAHNNQLMYGNQMMHNQQAMMMMNQQAMYGNPGMFPGQPVPGMYPGQPMPGMYGGAGIPGMYNPALVSPIGAPMVEMATPVATQVYPAVPVPSATVVAPSAPPDGTEK